MTVDRSVTIRLRVSSEQFDAAMAKAGTEIKLLAKVIDDVGKGSGQNGAKSGTEFAGAFDRAVRTGLEAASRSLPTLKVGASTSEAQRKLEEIKGTLIGLNDESLGIHLDDKATLAVVDKLKAELADLSKSHDIRVRVDATAAHAELVKLQEELNHVEKAAKRSTDIGIKPMWDAIVMLGPALVPIAGAAVTLGAGLLGLGATGVLAFKGIQQEIKANTALGKQYSAGLSVLSNDLNTLEGIAAKGVLSGFNRAVRDAQTQMPQLSRMVRDLSGVLGDTAANSLHGLIGGFQTFEPLIQHVSLYIDQLSARFAAWATGPGGGHFGATLGAEFDKVMPVLENLIGAAAKLIAAFAPVGNQIVGVLGAVTGAINSIPLPILQALAAAFSALYTANRLKGIFDGLSGSLANMSVKASGAKAEIAGIGSKAASMAGGFTALAVAGYAVGTSISKWVESGNSGVAVMNNLTNIHSSFTAALGASKGAIDDNVRSSAQYQFQQTGLIDKAGRAGITSDALTQALTGTNKQFDAMVANWKASGKPSSDTIFALTGQRVAFLAAQDAIAKANQANKDLATSQPNLWRSLSTSASSVQTVGDKYHLTAKQVQNYAAMLGISKDDIANGVVDQGKLADAVSTVAKAYDGATASGDRYLDALSKFAASDKGTADRAAFIGETLRAANGDALGYADSMVKAATANQSFVTAFDDARTAAVAAHVAFDDAKTGVVDLTRGTINYSNSAAGPLISNLQSMQDAAMKAAGATYQHETATKGAKQAASDAYTQYYAQTHGALIDEAKQLGLTDTQAGKLADSYFGIKNSGDIKKKIETIGADPVVAVLDRIGQQLAYLTGHPWTVTVQTVNTVQNQGEKHGADGSRSADGGTVGGRGGPRADDQLHWLSTGEEVIKNGPAQKFRGLLKAINADNVPGFADGGTAGFVGVTAPTPSVAGAKKAASAAKAAAGKAAATLSAQGAIQFTVENSDLPKFLASVKGTAAQINAAMTKLISDVHNAALKGLGSGSIIPTLQAETSRLEALANRRVAIAGQLKTANTNLAAAWKLYNDEASKVSTSIVGSFDITQAGNNGGYSSIDRIIADEKAKVAAADKFGTELKQLSGKGLNKALLQQLAEAGVAQAGVNVDALAAGSGSQIAQVNAYYARLGKSGGNVGHVVADSLYGAGVNSAKNLVAGLASQETAIKKQMGHLAGVMAKQLEKDLHLSNAFLDALIAAVSGAQARRMR